MKVCVVGFIIAEMFLCPCEHGKNNVWVTEQAGSQTSWVTINCSRRAVLLLVSWMTLFRGLRSELEYWRRFFLSVPSSYLLVLDAEGYCCIWSQSRTHAHSKWLFWSRDRPVAETCTWQHKILTRDRHPRPRRDSNPQSRQASGRRPTP